MALRGPFLLAAYCDIFPSNFNERQRETAAPGNMMQHAVRATGELWRTLSRGPARSFDFVLREADRRRTEIAGWSMQPGAAVDARGADRGGRCMVGSAQRKRSNVGARRERRDVPHDRPPLWHRMLETARASAVASAATGPSRAAAQRAGGGGTATGVTATVAGAAEGCADHRAIGAEAAWLYRGGTTTPPKAARKGRETVERGLHPFARNAGPISIPEAENRISGTDAKVIFARQARCRV
jgi:hypothetical protein